jgi:hypothetical protein
VMDEEEKRAFMEFRDLLTRMDGRLERLESDMEDVRHVLIEGNGKPAMTVRMALAENELARLAEERSERKMPRAAWVAILLSTLTAIASIVVAIAAAHK